MADWPVQASWQVKKPSCDFKNSFSIGFLHINRAKYSKLWIQRKVWSAENRPLNPGFLYIETNFKNTCGVSNHQKSHTGLNNKVFYSMFLYLVKPMNDFWLISLLYVLFDKDHIAFLHIHYMTILFSSHAVHLSNVKWHVCS